MDHAYNLIAARGATSLLLIADHASNHVPTDVALGISPVLLDEHIAVDIGVAPLAQALNGRIGCACILGGVSRLVIDLNREVDAPNIIPVKSDGYAIPGNEIDHVERAARIDRFWRPYHAKISSEIEKMQPKMLISLHSFTPRLSSMPDQARPWEIGVLYNEDDRAARIAIPALAVAGVLVGDQEPYSGKLLNATMNLHGEANGIPYFGIEVRQDLISDQSGVEVWADKLTPVILHCAQMVTGPGPTC